MHSYTSITSRCSQLLLTISLFALWQAGTAHADGPSTLSDPNAELELTTARRKHTAIRALDRLETMLADPNTPATGIAVWDSGLRGRVGVALDAFREPEGFRVRFEPMIELYNRGFGSGFPWELWRGALGLSLSYRTALPPFVLAVSLVYEHESDHSSSGLIHHVTDYIFSNAMALRFGAFFETADIHMFGRVALRGHFASCTNPALVSRRTETYGVCYEAFGEGNQSIGLALDLSARTGSADAIGIQGCAAVHLAYTVPTRARTEGTPTWVGHDGEARILEETRINLLAGVCFRDEIVGDLALQLEATFGNEQGLYRHEQNAHVGGALRWAPP